jgi:hypothetical protein
VPIASAAVKSALNPKNQPPYAGPFGAVRGTITVTGDEAPAVPLERVDPACEKARDVFGRVFREGPGRTLADVFVAVTGYPEYVPPEGEQRTLIARDCTYVSRTVGLTFGQRLDVQARGRQSYLPALIGGREGATMMALPNGSPVVLSPTQPGRFELRDLMRPYNSVELLVVQYSTFAVTGVDGSFEIRRVPPGEVTLNAHLPAARLTAEQKITVRPNQTTEAKLTLNFDRAAYEKLIESAAAAASAQR